MSSSIPNSRLLRIGHLNIFHLQNKVSDLCVYLDQPEPFHLFGITESRLNASISDESISIPNYSVMRRDPCSVGETGVAVYIHNTISHSVHRRLDLESLGVECIWIEIKNSNNKPLHVAFVYRNPAAIYEWYDDFLRTVEKAKIHKNDVLVLGDFNIDYLKPHAAWDCTTTLVGLEQLISSPTRITPRTSTLIDHIYANRPQAVKDVSVGNLSISDHYPVVCSWRYKVPSERKHGHITISYRSFKRFDQTSFLADLQQTPFDCVYNETDPNNALRLWYNLFMNVLDKHAPLRQKRIKNRVKPPWLSQEIIGAMELRDNLREQKLFPDYKKQRNRVKSMVLRAKKAHFDHMIKDNRDTSAIWRALNLFTRGGSKHLPSPPPHITADTFNNYFLSVVESVIPSTCDPTKYSCPDVLLHFCGERTAGTLPFSIPFLTVHEVGKLVRKMANKKSSGPDEISPKILKISLPYIVNSLTYIYNLCIHTSTVPTEFKKAKIIPLPKTKDINDVNNYRPISLLSVLSKPLEKHIHKNLQQYAEERGLLHSFQSGFRPKHSCHTALTRLVDMWLASINQSQVTGAIFLDFRKAFDLVNHHILLKKLDSYLCNNDSVNFFRSYLSGREQKVLLQGSYSSSGLIHHGVPQGSILGPLLFCFFINDLPLHLSGENVMCDIFADDTTIHTPDKDITVVSKRLQQSLQEVSSWCNTNCMVLNPSKTECMTITTRQKHQLGPLSLRLSLNDTTIKQVDQHRLLGLTVDSTLQWKPHVNSICKSVSRNLFMLAKLRYLTNADTRKIFFNAHVRPHIDYVSTAWDGSSDALLKRLNSLHRRGAKLILIDPTLSTDQKLMNLDILPLRKHFIFNKGVFMYKLLTQPAPEYIRTLFTASNSRNSRLAQALSVPYPRLDIFKSSLSYSGSCLWNSLPVCIRQARSLSSFKASLFKYLSTTDIKLS